MSPAWLRPIRLLSITVAAVLATLGVPSGVDAGLVVEFRNITGGREGGDVVFRNDATNDNQDVFATGSAELLDDARNEYQVGTRQEGES